MLLVALQVISEAEARALLGYIGGGLLQRKGQVLELFSGGIGGGIGFAAGAAQQQLAGGLRIQHPDRTLFDVGPVRKAGCDQRVAGAGFREPILDGFLILGVVQDQQALRGVRAAKFRADLKGLVGGFEFGKFGAQQVVDGGELALDRQAAVSPEDLPVASPEDFGVLGASVVLPTPPRAVTAAMCPCVSTAVGLRNSIS
jgi:hypothetical protein